MRRIVHILSGSTILLSGAWLYFSRDFEPLIALVGSIIAFLSSFDVSTPAIPVSPVATSSGRPLSDEALLLLSDIDGCDESDPKGVSLMMAGSTVGLYRPYIWDNHIHGPISGDERYDPSGKISAIDELVDLDYLTPHYESGSLLQWRRTTKRRS